MARILMAACPGDEIIRVRGIEAGPIRYYEEFEMPSGRTVQNGAAFTLGTILVVDDNEQFLVMLKRFLAKEGYDVLTAPNGKEALNIARRTHVDLIITDLVMPEKSGLEMLQDLKRCLPRFKLIAISGGAAGNPAWLPMARELGALRVIKKPFATEQLLKAVQECLTGTEVTMGYKLSFEPL